MIEVVYEPFPPVDDAEILNPEFVALLLGSEEAKDEEHTPAG